MPSAAIDEQVEAFPAILELKNRVQTLTNQYNRVADVVRSKSDPAVLAVRKQLDTAQRDLAASRANCARQLPRRSTTPPGRTPGLTSSNSGPKST